MDRKYFIFSSSSRGTVSEYASQIFRSLVIYVVHHRVVVRHRYPWDGVEAEEVEDDDEDKKFDVEEYQWLFFQKNKKKTEEIPLPELPWEIAHNS